MRSYSRLAVAAVLAAVGLSGGAVHSQQGMGELGIYKGEPLNQAPVTIGSWGSGAAREADDHIFVGSKSLKLTTHGRYQGARLMLNTPLNVKPLLDDRSAYLQFIVVLPPKDGSGDVAGPGGLGAGGGYGNMLQRGQGSGYGKGRGAPGGAGTGGAGQDRMVKPKPLANLRVLLLTTDGKVAETELPIDSATPAHDDWSSLAIPLPAITALKNTNGEIKEVRLFGDVAAVVYLGEARIVHDETPIRVDDLPEQTVPLNAEVTFAGSGDAGIAPLKYEWNFGTVAQPGVDKEGKSVKYRYRKRKEDREHNGVPYDVTLTVRDLYGLKAPVTRTTKVYVTL